MSIAKSKMVAKILETLKIHILNPCPTKVFFITYLTKGGHFDPLWKFVIKHPTFIKVVPVDS